LNGGESLGDMQRVQDQAARTHCGGEWGRLLGSCLFACNAFGPFILP